MAKPRSYGDTIVHYQGLLAGLKANAADFSGFQTELSNLETFTNEAVEKNLAQEEAAAKYHQLTDDLKKTMTNLKELSSRLESAVYAKYGKKNDKLEEFNLKAWKPGGRRGPRSNQTTA